jgi:hypothetical protein
MKHLKMLGLAAIAALGLMAFVGAGTASATTLSTDAAGTAKYGVNTVIDSTLTGTAVLEAGSTTLDTCTGGTVKGKITTATGTAVVGSIEELTWTGCTNTTDTLAGGSLSISRIGTEDKGTVEGSGSQVTVNTLGVTCTYGTGTGTHIGTLTGGSAPSLKISTTVPKIAGSFICPSNASWTAEYIVTEPHAVHVVG